MTKTLKDIRNQMKRLVEDQSVTITNSPNGNDRIYAILCDMDDETYFVDNHFYLDEEAALKKAARHQKQADMGKNIGTNFFVAEYVYNKGRTPKEYFGTDTARDPSKNDIQNLYKALVNNDFSETRYYNGMIISTPTGYYLLDDVVFSNGPACGFTVANGSYYFHPENVNIEDVKQHLKKVAEDKDDLLDYVDGTKSF